MEILAPSPECTHLSSQSRLIPEHVTRFAIGLAIPSVLLGTSIQHLKEEGLDMSPAGLLRQGFTFNGAFLVGGTVTESFGSGTTILIANSFQILVSFLYLFYNNILTRQLVADEWTRFLRPSGKKPLRVSSPVGMQRSSYALSLPFKYSIPLMVAMMALHSLVSQSIFIVSLVGFGPGPDPVRLSIYDKSSVGYSPLGISLSLALGGGLITALVVNSFLRHYPEVPPDFPAMGMSSAAISTFCQRPDGDPDAFLFPVSLGLVPGPVNDGRSGHEGQGLTDRLVFSTFIRPKRPENTQAQYLRPANLLRRPGRLSQAFKNITHGSGAMVASSYSWIAPVVIKAQRLARMSRE